MSIEARQGVVAFAQSNTEVGTVSNTSEISEDDDLFKPADNSTRNEGVEMRAEQKKDDGGCMKVFAMVLQAVAPLLALIPGVGPAVAAAVAAASKAISAMTQQGGGGGGGSTVDTAAMQREFEKYYAEADAANQQLFGTAPTAPART